MNCHEFLILRLDNWGTSRFIISVSQFDQSVESEILMSLFTLQVCLLKHDKVVIVWAN